MSKSNNVTANFVCSTCDNFDTEDYDAMKNHLEDVHGVNVKEDVFSKSLVLHTDSRDSYTSVYEYVNDRVKFRHSIMVKRGIDDPMRF